MSVFSDLYHNVKDKLTKKNLLSVGWFAVIALTPVHYQLDKILGVFGIHLTDASTAEKMIESVTGDAAVIAGLVKAIF